MDNPGDENPALGARSGFRTVLGGGRNWCDVRSGARLQRLVLNLAGQYAFEDDSVLTLEVGFGTP